MHSSQGAAKKRTRKTSSRLLGDFDMCPDVKDDRPGVDLGIGLLHSAVCEIRVLMGKLNRAKQGTANSGGQKYSYSGASAKLNARQIIFHAPVLHSF